MIKLSPLRSTKIWGYEDWIASTHSELPQKELLELNKNFPLLVKIIQADQTLSVQVHPDDKTACSLEGDNASGKTECWYVLDAKENAKIVYGLKKDYSKQEILTSIENKDLESLLNQVSVQKGDFIYIPAGTIHAIEGGLRLLEIQQSCNITYRFYDWNRGRELHINKAIASVKNNTLDKIAPLQDNFSCPYFDLNKKIVKGGYSFLCSDFELVFILSGKNLASTFTLNDGTRTENMYLYEEEIFAVLPGEKVTIEGNGQILRIKNK